jgi:hypothetical protein
MIHVHQKLNPITNLDKEERKNVMACHMSNKIFNFRFDSIRIGNLKLAIND